MLTKDELKILEEKSHEAYIASKTALATAVTAAMTILTTSGYKFSYSVRDLTTRYDFDKHCRGDFYVSTTVEVLTDDGKKEFGANFSLNIFKDYLQMNIGTVGDVTKADYPAHVNMYKVVGFLWNNEKAICKTLFDNLDKLNVFALENTVDKLNKQYREEEEAIRDYESKQATQAFFNQLKPGAILYSKYEYENKGTKIPCYKIDRVCEKVAKANPYNNRWHYDTQTHSYDLNEYVVENVRLSGMEYNYVILE